MPYDIKYFGKSPVLQFDVIVAKPNILANIFAQIEKQNDYTVRKLLQIKTARHSTSHFAINHFCEQVIIIHFVLTASSSLCFNFNGDNTTDLAWMKRQNIYYELRLFNFI